MLKKWTFAAAAMLALASMPAQAENILITNDDGLTRPEGVVHRPEGRGT